MRSRAGILLCAALAAAVSAGPAAVLFIGNSYTFANGGLALHLRAFYASAHPGSSIDTGEITAGGATLENHWNNPAVREALSGGDWDLAVMQEQSTRPVTDPVRMYLYADSLGNLAAASGTVPAFLMTWARRNDPEMLGDLSDAYRYAAGLSGAPVIPVGEAFRRAELEHPEILLYEADDSHPGPKGTYLAVCLLYAILYGESPVGVEYVSNPSITPRERLALQETAAAVWLAGGGEGTGDIR